MEPEGSLPYSQALAYPVGGMEGSNPPEIPKFWKSWAKFRSVEYNL
jgi:hypothetical protein